MMWKQYFNLLWLGLIETMIFPTLLRAQNPSLPNNSQRIEGSDLINPNRDNLPEIVPPANLPSLEQLFPPETNPLQPPSVFDEIPGQIKVQNFDFEGNTVFSDQELQDIIKDYLNQPITFAQLLEIQEKITRYYTDNNYISSGSYIAPQSLKTIATEIDGTKIVEKLTISIVEGAISEINIEGLWRLNPNYLKSRLQLGAQTPLNQERLLTSLQMLQLDPLLESISAELSAGVRPGESILDVRVREADASFTRFSLDNYRSPSVGSVRRQIEFTHHNFLGWGDRFSVGYLNTDGSDSLDQVSYTLPFNAHNGMIGFRHSRSDSNIIETPFNLLDIQSQSVNYELTVRQPLIQTPNQELALGLTSSWQESTTSLLNIPFPLSRGANDLGETRIFALRFFQEYTERNEREVFALRSQLNWGLGGVFDSTVNATEPDSEFLSWRGQAQYLTLIGEDSILLLRGDLQLAKDGLVPLEQFSAGGGLSVRGYRQDVLLADNGLFGSVEFRTPILKIPEWDAVVQLTPFFDFGTVWNSDGTPLETQTISSVGLGLRFSLGNNFNARLDWGVPLVGLDRRGNSLQENGIHFSLEFLPF